MQILYSLRVCFNKINHIVLLFFLIVPFFHPLVFSNEKLPGEKKQIKTPENSLLIFKSYKNKNEKFVIVELVKPSNDLRAIGFDLQYSTDKLKYINYKKGLLIEKFDLFQVVELQKGLLRVGGVEARDDHIKKTQCGEMLTLRFQIIDNGESPFHVFRLKDDIAQYKVIVQQEEK